METNVKYISQIVTGAKNGQNIRQKDSNFTDTHRVVKVVNLILNSNNLPIYLQK